MSALDPTRRRPLLAALTLALAGCAPEAAPPPALPVAPPVAAPAPAATQVFAEADPPLAFRDPERRKKLAAAFPKIDEIGADELRKQGLPSLVVGVVVDGELAYVKGFGAAGDDPRAPPDADTVYRIGSITKSFTATALIALRDEGALALDDTLAKWIPEAAGLVYPTHDAPPLTLRQLLTHTSGLPRVGKLPGGRTDKGPTEEELVGSLAGLHLENPPGHRHLYSNLGFALLGIVVGRAGHAPYREVVNRRVLAPLGMTSTFWEQDSVPRGRLAIAYAKGPLGVPVATPHWILGAEEGAGGLYASARDLARYLAFELAAYPPRSGPEAGPLRRSSVREGHESALWDSLHVQRSQAPQKGESLVDAAAYRYGYGWVAEQTCELDALVWHNGGIDGYRTDVTFLPEHGVGVIALIDLNSAAPEPVVARVLTELRRSGGLGKRAPTVAPAFAPVMKTFLEVYNAWDEAKYQAMLTTGRRVRPSEEREELAGYQKLHGACTGLTPLVVRGPSSAVFRMECARGTLDMDVVLAPDGRITGFSGTSRDVPVPAGRRQVAERLVGLVAKWDDGVFKKHLAGTKKTRDDAARFFAELRATHAACSVKALVVTPGKEKIALDCERGGEMLLELAVDAKKPEEITGYGFTGVGQGTCPVR